MPRPPFGPMWRLRMTAEDYAAQKLASAINARRGYTAPLTTYIRLMIEQWVRRVMKAAEEEGIDIESYREEATEDDDTE